MATVAFVKPPNEVERLAALREYQILDTPAEPAFDDLARLIARICETPIGLISFVDENRVWLKARVGLDQAEMPREMSLCSLAILEPGLFLVNDLSGHPEFSLHPLVRCTEGLRFFASMPVRTPEGFTLGGLCVLDRVPRQLRPEQIEALEVLGRQVEVQLELRKNLRRLEVTNANHERVEAALREAEEKYRGIFENVVEGIFQTTPEGHYLSANPKLAQIYGYASPQDLMNAVHDISHQLYVEPGRRRQFIDQIQRTGEVRAFESQIYRKDGSCIWISENARAVRDTSGQVQYYEGTVEDVTDRHNAEDALQQSEVLYHSLVECLPQSIFRKDTQGRFTFVNSLFCQTIKRLPKDVLGKTDFDLFPEPLARKYQEDDQRVMANAQGMDTVEEHVRPDGSKLYVHVVKTPLNDAAGQVIGVQGIFWDETERRRIEQQLAYERDLLQALLDSVPDAIYFKDRKSRFLRASRALAERVGLRDSIDLVGKTDFDLFDDDHARDAYEDEQRIIRTGQPFLGKTEREGWRDGSVHWVLTSKMPLRSRDGDIIGTFGVSKDVTDLVMAEETLKKARDAALETAQLKAQFLANMSHEIRTPMNAIIGMTGLLLDSELTPEQRDCAETVRRSADALLGIINSVLDFSKLDAGRMRLEVVDFDLRDAVESTAELLAETAHSKGLELVCWLQEDLPCAVRGDAGRLRQVLTNLLGNAIKFTEQGQVVLRVRTVVETDNQVTVRFEVQDTGIGIAPEARPRIFEAFAQGDGSTTRRYGGTGLGLSISRQLVEVMGGHIDVESTPDSGSTFWFEVSLPRQSGQVAGDDKPAVLAGKRVLVIDDNATNRAMLASQLSYWNMVVAEAPGAPDAMSALVDATRRGEPFDAALIDAEMPGTDGLVLAETINSQPDLAGTRLVMLSWLSNRLDLPVMRTTGVCACLIKPPRRARLRDTLVRVLGAPTAALGVLSEEYLAPELAPPSSPTTGRPLRVLVAEDNMVNQKLAVRQLRKLGHKADSVANGREVLQTLENVPYDVLLLDCQMPELDGYETARRIRQHESPGTDRGGVVRPPLYIIAMTANAMEGDREKCLAAGMDDYVSKPVQFTELDQALQRAATNQVAGDAVPPAAGDNRPAPGPSPASPADEVPALDHEVFGALRQLATPGEPDPTHELVDLFLQEVDKEIARLQEALARGDAGTLRASAHSVKGCANNLGVRRVASVAASLEQLGRQGELENAPELLAALSREYAAVRPLLTQARAGVGALAARGGSQL